jgi:hypothetical protein
MGAWRGGVSDEAFSDMTRQHTAALNPVGLRRRARLDRKGIWPRKVLDWPASTQPNRTKKKARREPGLRSWYSNPKLN